MVHFDPPRAFLPGGVMEMANILCQTPESYGLYTDTRDCFSALSRLQPKGLLQTSSISRVLIFQEGGSYNPQIQHAIILRVVMHIMAGLVCLGYGAYSFCFPSPSFLFRCLFFCCVRVCCCCCSLSSSATWDQPFMANLPQLSQPWHIHITIVPVPESVKHTRILPTGEKSRP